MACCVLIALLIANIRRAFQRSREPGRGEHEPADAEHPAAGVRVGERPETAERRVAPHEQDPEDRVGRDAGGDHPHLRPRRRAPACRVAPHERHPEQQAAGEQVGVDRDVDRLVLEREPVQRREEHEEHRGLVLDRQRDAGRGAAHRLHRRVMQHGDDLAAGARRQRSEQQRDRRPEDEQRRHHHHHDQVLGAVHPQQVVVRDERALRGLGEEDQAREERHRAGERPALAARRRPHRRRDVRPAERDLDHETHGGEAERRMGSDQHGYIVARAAPGCDVPQGHSSPAGCRRPTQRRAAGDVSSRAPVPRRRRRRLRPTAGATARGPG